MAARTCGLRVFFKVHKGEGFRNFYRFDLRHDCLPEKGPIDIFRSLADRCDHGRDGLNFFLLERSARGRQTRWKRDQLSAATGARLFFFEFCQYWKSTAARAARAPKNSRVSSTRGSSADIETWVMVKGSSPKRFCQSPGPEKDISTRQATMATGKNQAGSRRKVRTMKPMPISA